MKCSDYIVKFLVDHGVSDIFGYPGATVCHLMDSLEKNNRINNHLNYHEQACAFAACGYAQSTGKIGVAYANGGPGFTNLITGIINAYYDSIPTVFICGQVDTTDMVGDRKIRQNGIQEIPISRIARPFTKKAILVDSIENLQICLEEAFRTAYSDRPGPVVLEVPANIQRGIIEEPSSKMKNERMIIEYDFGVIDRMLAEAQRPIIIAGNGIKVSGLKDCFRKAVNNLKIPVVFTLPAFDLLEFENEYNFGFIGNNGFRYSNYILEKSDLIISIGSRLDEKQTGKDSKIFVHGAKLIRIDIDPNELSEKISDDEIQINVNAKYVLDYFNSITLTSCNKKWLEICKKLKGELYGYDFTNCHNILQKIFEKASDDACFTADVGHHEIYLAQALRLKEKQNAILSLGLASMGYSLPAAIGAYFGKRTQVVSVSGDGGIQMNLQELQTLSRDNIPVKVIVFNNNALGMVREFQERNFNSVCCQTTEEYGYIAPDFELIANAYGIRYTKLRDTDIDGIEKFKFSEKGPEIIELMISEQTYLYPRYARGKRICDMDPELDLKKKIIVEHM